MARIRAFGRKGWLPAFRDATLFKTAYAFGTRRNETRILDAADFGLNPHGTEYGEFGLCRVRFGKAKKGSPPKRRTVLTVWDWAPDILDEWFTEVRPLFGGEGNPAAWPSEHGLRIGCQRLNSRFITYRQAVGLDEGLDFHSFRRSYVTHLISRPAGTEVPPRFMSCGVLPAVDKQICSLERWLIGHLADIPDPDHAQVIRRFATWEVLPRLRTSSQKKPITPAARRHAADQVKQATAFLTWLAARDHTLGTCGQTGIDAWHAEQNEYTRNTMRAFLRWCSASKLTRPFRLPPIQIRRATPMPQPERLELIGRLLTDPDLSLRTRVAGVIVLLYAQPLSRVVRLTLDDIGHSNDQTLLGLGEPPSPVPEPLAELLHRWISSRDNMNTATNHASRWLFPGRRAG